MQKKILFASILMLLIASMSAIYVEVGTGTEQGTHLPMEPYWSYSMSQTIYNRGLINVSNHRIVEISYYFNGYSAWNEDIKIYMKHHQLSSFAGQNSWTSSNGLTLVYDGQISTTTEAGWITIVLDTPFNYNNIDNLLVAFEANSPGYASSGNNFLGTTVTEEKSIFHYSDSVNSDFVSPVAGTTSNIIPNTRFTMNVIPTGPSINVNPTSLDFGNIYLGRTGTTRVNITNTGVANLSGTISSTGTELTFSPQGFSILPSGVIQAVVQLNPQAVGPYNGSFTITSNDPDHPSVTVTTTANVLPAIPDGLAIIGDGTSSYQDIPFSTSRKHSYSQTIYYSNEIGFTNQRIEKIGWHYNGGSALGPDDIKIYMGLTSATEFEEPWDWISIDQMVQVYDGTIIVPSTDGMVSVFLDNPFEYTNTQNLVVGVLHSSEFTYSFSDSFYCTPSDVVRTLMYDNDTNIPNPVEPPWSGLWAKYRYPNIHLQFGTIPVGPVVHVHQNSLAFGDVSLNRVRNASLTIGNTGIQNLVVNLAQPGTELSFAPATLTILPSQTAQVIVTLSPEVEGDYNGSFTVNSNDPLHPEVTVTTNAFVLPAEPVGIVTIGDGTQYQEGLPIHPYYKHSYTQSIYYADEIGLNNQRIEKISWHYNGGTAFGPDELKIYMGHTSATHFSGYTGWINPNTMEEVYDGTITVPSANGLVEIVLDNPFIYSNLQNLVIGVFYSSEQYYGFNDGFYCTGTNANRSLVYCSDMTIPNPMAPPTADYLRNSYSNVQLNFGEIPQGVELTVAPSDIAFEMIGVHGFSNQQTISMRSTGLENAIIPSAPVIVGNHASQFTITTDNNNYPLTLALGQRTTFAVSFTPNVEGSKSAIVQITGQGREVYTVNLSGYAYGDDGNDQPTGATVLTLPVNGTTYAIMPSGDVDWYKIPAMGIGDTLTAYTTLGVDSNVITKLWLYGPVANPANLPGNSFIASGFEIEHVLPESGDYYLRVAEVYSNPRGSNPNTRWSFNEKSERNLRDNTGLYNLFVSANYFYDYNSPLNLEANNGSVFVELSWEEPPYERYLIGYNVFRDGSLISEEMIPIGTDFYHDASVVIGTEYSYYVVGMYEEPTGMSLPSNTVTITYFSAGEPLWGDDFENHPDFTINLQNWIQHDVDGGDTYGISNVEFENQGEPMSYIVFNPASTTPPITDMAPLSGNKFLAFFASMTGTNNDWIVTPRITIGTTTVVSFHARSYTSDYGLEKFKVKMSSGGSQVEDFTYVLHHGQPFIQAPTEWTFYNFNVSELAGSTARFAIQCVSTDAFMLMIDDFRIDSTDDGVDNENVEIIPQMNVLNQNYPNPFNPETSISFDIKEAGKVSLDIYNVKGQKVKTLLNDHREAGTHNIVWNGTDDNNRSVSSGIYFYKMKNGKFSSTKKMILMK